MPSATVHHFFVDEAGDLTLFDRKKRLVLGREGVSSTFIVGAALVADPIGVAERLGALRARLLADPLLAGAASMQPDAGRTAVAFHANKDLPEVRLEVFRQLMREEIRVFAAIRRKHRLADEVREFQEQTGSKRDMESVYESSTPYASTSGLSSMSTTPGIIRTVNTTPHAIRLPRKSCCPSSRLGPSKLGRRA